nr:pentatricopeptide repeat-containing protein, chloroplastic [Quercus suber]
MFPPKPNFFTTSLSLFTLRLHSSYTRFPLPPQPPGLSLLADQCTSMRQLKQVHAQMIASARIHDTFAASRLLSFCALSDSGDVLYALKIFENTQTPNGFMWNTLIRANASGPNPCEALFLYVHTHVVKFGLDLDLHVVNGLYDSSIADKLLFYMFLTLWITKEHRIH